MFIQNDECPWNVPVPVIAGRFTSLLREHDALNLCVDPAGAGAFGCEASLRPNGSLLFADLQTNVGAHIVGRLGSGRSGFFDKWYLKGVGRTPLAANWNRPDHLHNTGHLAASAAIREYLVTSYLSAHGCGDSVVGCEGLLFAELDPKLRQFQELLYGTGSGEHMPAADAHLQAITVKRGNFARLSNFLWLLHHLTPARVNYGQTSLATFAQLLAEAITPPGEPLRSASELEPATLAHMLSEAVARACEHFRCWFAKGVWWASFTNNFTIDGRFLDLETPAILGGPFFGVLSGESDEILRPGMFGSGVIGVELYAYLLQMKTFCTELVRVLADLPQWFSPVEKEFAAEFAREVKCELLCPQSLLCSRTEGINKVRNLIEGEMEPLRTAAGPELTRMLELEYDDYFGDLEQDHGGCGRIAKSNARFVRVSGFPFFATEPSLHWTGFALTPESTGPLCPSPRQLQTCRFVNGILADLDRTTSLHELLDKLLLVPELMRQAVAQ